MYHILIIDDSPVNISTLTDILHTTYRISIASSATNTFDIIKKDPPDLILLNTMMPEMDGFQICQHLKASAETAKIPIIFIAAKTEAKDEQKGFEMGAVDYITTPISSFSALARINNFFELIQMRAHLEEITRQTLQLRRKLKEYEARDKMIRFHMQKPQGKNRNHMLRMPMGRS